MHSDTSAVPLSSLQAPPPSARERALVTAVWFLLFCSSLAWSVGTPGFLVTLPNRVEQVGTALALGAAVYLAYKSNPRLRLTGSWPVVLYALLPILALCAPLAGVGGAGTFIRPGRFFIAIAALALLAPTWRRDPWLLANAHARVLRLVVAAALISLALGKGRNPDGRLIAQVPALRAPQVGQFAAVLVGITVVQAVTRSPRLSRGPLWIVLGVTALLLSETRTPLIAGAVGLTFAMLLLGLSHARARRAIACLVVAGPLLAVILIPFFRDYIRRDQSDEFLASLTGRKTAWAMVFDLPRTGFEQLFGVGYGDKSIEGRPIDNGYLATYHELGKVGLVLVVCIIAVFAFRALLCPQPERRALAVFLVTFVAIASYTETGIGDMSPYVMHLVLAGAIVTPIVVARARAPGGSAPVQ